jgi:hypothetical protein
MLSESNRDESRVKIEIDNCCFPKGISPYSLSETKRCEYDRKSRHSNARCARTIARLWDGAADRADQRGPAGSEPGNPAPPAATEGAAGIRVKSTIKPTPTNDLHTFRLRRCSRISDLRPHAKRKFFGVYWSAERDRQHRAFIA